MLDPMAGQMTQLLLDSDLEELTEIVKRWTMEATTAESRHYHEQFGEKLLALKRHLVTLPVMPSHDELASALDMMLKLAASRPQP